MKLNEELLKNEELRAVSVLLAELFEELEKMDANKRSSVVNALILILGSMKFQE